jgi:hypothetical protein
MSPVAAAAVVHPEFSGLRTTLPNPLDQVGSLSGTPDHEQFDLS